MTIREWIMAASMGAGTIAIVLGYVYSLALLTEYYNPYIN